PGTGHAHRPAGHPVLAVRPYAAVVLDRLVVVLGPRHYFDRRWLLFGAQGHHGVARAHGRPTHRARHGGGPRRVLGHRDANRGARRRVLAGRGHYRRWHG